MGSSQSQLVDKTTEHQLSPAQPSVTQQSNANDQQSNSSSAVYSAEDKDNGPGTFEDLHKKCKGNVLKV